MAHQMNRGLCHAPRAAGGADAAALRPEGSPLGGQEKATRFSSLQPLQRRRRKPGARMPQARNASNSSVTNVGRPAPPSVYQRSSIGGLMIETRTDCRQNKFAREQEVAWPSSGQMWLMPLPPQKRKAPTTHNGEADIGQHIGCIRNP